MKLKLKLKLKLKITDGSGVKMLDYPGLLEAYAKWLLELAAGDASVPRIRLGLRHVLQQIFPST